MSELTPCNHCSLIGVRQYAKKKGESIFVIPCTAHGGFDLFHVKKGDKPRNIRHKEKYIHDGIKDSHCIADNGEAHGWMMEISDSCAC